MIWQQMPDGSWRDASAPMGAGPAAIVGAAASSTQWLALGVALFVFLYYQSGGRSLLTGQRLTRR